MTGRPRSGRETRQKFKANLPYTLSTVSKIVAMDRPNSFEVDVVGDLRGHGVWTLTPRTGRSTCASTGTCSPTGPCSGC